MLGDGLLVGVNLLWCLPGGVGGSEEYLARQLAGVRRAAPEIRLRLAVLATYPAAHPEVVGAADDGGNGVEVVVARVDARRRSRRVVAETTWLPSRLAGVDVVHHGGGTVPPRSPRPIVVTIHDLQFLRFPAYVSPLKLRYLRAAVPRAVRRAAVVAVPSEYVRSTIVDAYGASPERVVVVPSGVDRPMTLPDKAALRRRYDLGDRPFVVYPALTHPHKQHRFLLDLMAGAHGRWADPDLLLVALGGRGLAEHDVATSIIALGLEDRVRRPGRVPDTDRDGLIAAAEALVFPSQYEGFGAPIVEAMALGTPVVASDQAAVPEVAGNAAVIRPLDRDAWIDALDLVDTRRSELIAAGLQRASQFSVRRSGAALASAYHLAAGGQR